MSDSAADRVDLNHFHHGQSHQNDPLGAAVAGKVMEIIKRDNLLNIAETLGNFIKERLNRIIEKHGIIKEVRGRGLLIALEFVKNEKYSYAGEINNRLLEKNIILVRRPGLEVFRIDPALTIDRQDIDFFLDSLEKTISSL